VHERGKGQDGYGIIFTENIIEGLISMVRYDFQRPKILKEDDYIQITMRNIEYRVVNADCE
jgi:hypothetical protein